MRIHTENLGIKSNLYGLFVCMVTGRPWETVAAGVTKRVQDEREVCFKYYFITFMDACSRTLFCYVNFKIVECEKPRIKLLPAIQL